MPASGPKPLSQRAGDGTAFDVSGPSGRPAIVLIHGLGLCRRLWDQHIDAFTANHRVINYDLYGHGESGPSPEQTSLRTYADQIAGLLDELAIDRAALVGFSIGGMINRRFAIDHPERVSALCILNSPHDRGADGQRLVEERAASVRDQGALSTMDSALARWFTPGFLEANPGYGDLVRQWRLKADPESYAQAAWVLANGVTELIDPSPPVSAPTLVMTGENDSGSTVAMSNKIAAEIHAAETTIVDGYQHLGLLEDPSAFTGPVVEFLQRVLGDASETSRQR